MLSETFKSLVFIGSVASYQAVSLVHLLNTLAMGIIFEEARKRSGELVVAVSTSWNDSW